MIWIINWKITFTNDEERDIILNTEKNSYSCYLEVVILEIIVIKLTKLSEKVIVFIYKKCVYYVQNFIHIGGEQLLSYLYNKLYYTVHNLIIFIINTLHSNSFSVDWIDLAVIGGIEYISQVKKRNQTKTTSSLVWKKKEQIDK